MGVCMGNREVWGSVNSAGGGVRDPWDPCSALNPPSPAPPAMGWVCALLFLHPVGCRAAGPTPDSPQTHPRGKDGTTSPPPQPNTDVGHCPIPHSSGTTRHRATPHHATSRQHDKRKHGQTRRPRGHEGGHGARTHTEPTGYLPSLSLCHVFSRACPVEAMSEGEHWGTAWDGTWRGCG